MMYIMDNFSLSRQLQYKAQEIINDLLGMSVYPTDILIDENSVVLEGETVLIEFSFSIKNHASVRYNWYEIYGNLHIISNQYNHELIITESEV